MKKIILLLLLVSAFSAKSQNNAIGLKIGDPTGLSFKHYAGNHALEFNIGRTGWFHGRNWYDKNFDYWYDHKKYNYSYLSYTGYRAYTPVSLQFHYLVQKDIEGLEGLQWYFGFGLQARFQKYYYYYKYKVNGDPYLYVGEERVTDLDMGLDAVIGLEYKFPDVPLSLFLDANIFLEVFDHPFYPWGQGGFGARFHF